MARKFALEKAPFIRSADEKIITTKRIMTDVVIALIPIALFAWIKNGIIPLANQVTGATGWTMIRPLLFIIVACLASMVFEGLYFMFFKYIIPNRHSNTKIPWNFKTIIQEVQNSYAIIPGLILALILPVNTPFFVLLFGCFMANIVFKMLFGGFGHNIFNPALIAYAIIIVTFMGTINAGGGYLNIGEILTGATPLERLATADNITYANIVAPFGNLWDFFLGTIPGSLGETSALLCILGMLFLIIRKDIDWRVPVIYIGTVFIITTIITLITGYGFWYPVFNIFSGGLMFSAVFMATEPVTTPRSPNAKVIFAVGLGIFTVLFRLVGAYTEGVGTSLLFMCLFTPIIDSFASRVRSENFSYKVILRYVPVVLLYGVLATYTILKVVGVL